MKGATAYTAKEHLPFDPDNMDIAALQRVAVSAARANLALGLPAILGGNYFYEVDEGWEGKVLQDDADTCIAATAWELEAGLEAPAPHTIIIPATSPLTAATARRICARHTGAKTVFFEHAAAVTASAAGDASINPSISGNEIDE